ncbi:dienelactone hydrolase family protein [Parahaliea aestuarii]|uniref:Dienelactone hydrolase family protein n=1 Tax=Parahaliea aestuarii TaxID=1852021 RepID=A0A5C9A089_9GAMM|nr:dienelactone hydrolase family protein [Parahaliea aestuarii]TXS93302.1 dienelactone hydrolase family protein [Parahaliea aestuarii]
MPIQTREVEYQYQSQTFAALLAWDDSREGPRPAVAIAHTWAGRGDFEEGRALALADMGYVAMALDVYGKGVHGSSPQENQQLMAPLKADRALLQGRLLAGVEAMAGQAETDATRMAAIGYCFGGLCALDLARIGAPLRAVVSLHGLFDAPDNTAGNRIAASVLCLHGYDDPMAPPESVLALASEMSAAGADWQLHAYGNTVHAFSNPAANNPQMGTLYSPAADRRSWQALGNFLEETLG